MDRIFLHAPIPGPAVLPAGLQPYAAAIAAHLRQPTAWFIPRNALATAPAQSKIGGWPYLPLAAPNPLLDHAEHRFNLLVQVNLAEVPAPRPHFFPNQGLLQVFTRAVEDVLDEEPGAIRCVYYPTVTTEAAALVTDFSAYTLADLEGYEGVPAEGLAVAFQTLTTTAVALGNDHGGLAHLFAEVADPDEKAELLDLLAEYLTAHNDTVPDTDAAWADVVTTQYPHDEDDRPVFNSPVEWYGFGLPDHQLGGVLSQFWQGDPRLAWDEATHRPHHDQLLLAYDARGNCTEWAVPFLTHDAKLLFFINRDQLAHLDFSDLLVSYMA